MLKIARLADHPDLIPACARWNHTEWGHSAGFSEQHITDAFHDIAHCSEGQAALIAFWDHHPAGMVLLIHNDLETHSHLKPWLASLFVTADFRGKGIGGSLVTAVEQAGASLGYRQIYLYTGTPAFYQPLGWSKFEELTGDYSDMTILQKQLVS
ncbi:N-acetyltransferase [Falsochrobactrum shanghaiense]|uniref:N-acetyltransferase n=1 Tax=Falsochrobactrum shanghaiense TaxID=2201899 RepID=A0A316J4E3_9HYPH|nr:GNAT family N-acetyltransferase [Falsochrobactrum shanghaiense]PWL16201.1 N-acetyltransferase [Falsochrobactrum shanghaiense]